MKMTPATFDSLLLRIALFNYECPTTPDDKIVEIRIKRQIESYIDG